MLLNWITLQFLEFSSCCDTEILYGELWWRGWRLGHIWRIRQGGRWWWRWRRQHRSESPRAFSEYLPLWPWIRTLILLSSYQNTRSSSFAKELAARIKGDAIIKAEGDRACKSPTWWIIYEHLFPSHVECHPCMCMLMLFCFYHVLSGKRWHLRRKVKAGKSQSLQSRRVWTSSIIIIIIISDSLLHFVCILFCLRTNAPHCPWSTADEDDDDMFKPPKMDDGDDDDDDFSPFGGKGGLFSGGRGLFDDDDEVF